jgi:hypothetical protein
LVVLGFELGISQFARKVLYCLSPPGVTSKLFFFCMWGIFDIGSLQITTFLISVSGLARIIGMIPGTWLGSIFIDTNCCNVDFELPGSQASSLGTGGWGSEGQKQKGGHQVGKLEPAPFLFQPMEMTARSSKGTTGVLGSPPE